MVAVFHIEFPDREIIVDRMQAMADDLNITVEQLIKRFICEGMRNEFDNAPCVPGNSLDDLFVKNGVLKPR